MAQNQQPASYSGTQKRNPFDNILADDDEFGDFTSAVSFTPSLNGGFHSAAPPLTTNGSVFFNPLLLAHQGEIEDDDEFGDFCAQPSVQIEETVVVPTVKCQPNYNIDLEIDSCLSWGGPSPIIAARVQQPEEVEEEEFSQFTSSVPEPPSDAPVDLFDSHSVSDDLISLTNDVGSLLVLEPSSTVVASVEVAAVMAEDEFGDFEQAVINEEPLDLEVPVISFEPVQETQAVQPTEEDHSSVHVFSEITESVPVLPEHSLQPQLPVEEVEDDDFGDFTTGFQAAAEPIGVEQVEDNDDEFDDFEVAPPPVALPSVKEEEDVQQTAEIRLKRLLNTIFPCTEPAAVATSSSPTCLSPLSSRGALWSYVSQLDSTPALSFQWRHSTAHQRFLNSLKMDSIQQQGTLHPAKWHWPSPTSSANSSTVGESLSESSMSHTVPTVSALDLDFFLNPSNTGTTSTSAVNADSLLESIEQELLSSPTKTIASTVQSPPVHHHHQMDDIWGHHQSTAQGPPTVANVLDLLN